MGAFMGFQDELNQASRSKATVAEEEREREIWLGKREAEREYANIKKQLLEKAKKGEYQIVDGKKQIVLIYHSVHVSVDFRLLENRMLENNSIFASRRTYTNIVKVILKNEAHFDSYMQHINELGKDDGVKIKAIGIYDDRIRKKKVPFEIPGGIQGKNAFAAWTEVALECVVNY